MTKKVRTRTALPKAPKPKEQQQPGRPPVDASAAEVQEGAAKDAFKKLRRAVRAKVRKQSEKIAESLVNSALKGNSSSTRIMVSLVEKKTKDKSRPKGKRGHSLALDLASDPQLPPEDDDWAREEERELLQQKPDALPPDLRG